MTAAIRLSAVIIFAAVIAGCAESDEPAPRPDYVLDVPAAAETPPVPDADDAADDPAVWVNRANPGASLVIGTNKQRGLEVYDLSGARLSSLDIGRANNVDLRETVLAGAPAIVVAATNRSHEGVDVLRLDPDTAALSPLMDTPIASPFSDEIYGLCLYAEPDGDVFVFANAKSGEIGQWRLSQGAGGGLTAQLVRRLSVPSQPEGCVADDENGALFVGEEAAGIWRFSAAPDGPVDGVLIASTFETDPERGRLRADVEGLALYAPPQAGPQNGFLIASSQGDFTYAVFDRAAPHAWRGTFAIEAADGVDGAQETDGIDVTALALPGYPEGLLVVQDGFNATPSGEAENQNFKYVGWAAIDDALGLSPSLMTLVAQGGAEIPVTDAWLDGLPETAVETETPWTTARSRFTGPAAADVFARAGVDEGLARITAVDGYIVEVDIAEVIALGGVFARTRNGAPLDPDQNGPVWLVYPYDDLSDEDRARAVSGMSPWAIERVEIEDVPPAD